MLAGRRSTGQREYPRSDDRADPQCRERPRAQGLLQPVFRLFRVSDQFVDGLLGKKLAGQNGLLAFDVG
jgi:hypothetical protein